MTFCEHWYDSQASYKVSDDIITVTKPYSRIELASFVIYLNKNEIRQASYKKHSKKLDHVFNNLTNF